MLQLFIVEPRPNLSAALKTSSELCVMGCESTPAPMLDQAVNCDLMLVSAAFARDEVTGLVRANEERETLTVITEIDEQDPLLVTFLEAGAAGYIKRGATPREVVQTLNAIHLGNPPLSPTVGTALLDRMHELLALERRQDRTLAGRGEVELPELTARERQVLELIRSGSSNQDIARALTIELGTVKNHVHNILKKLNVSRRDEAALLLDRAPVAQ